MTFKAFEIALELVRLLNPIIEELAGKDPELADQIRRARTSGPLNLNEGRRRRGKDPARFYGYAAGSFDEIVAALRVAEAAGYLKRELIAAPLDRCDQLLAITWTLTH